MKIIRIILFVIMILFFSTIIVSCSKRNYEMEKKYNYPELFTIQVDYNGMNYMFHNESIIKDNCVTGLSNYTGSSVININKRTICSPFIKKIK